MWDADISTPARTFPITLRYPNHFPHSPPLVLPRGDSGVLAIAPIWAWRRSLCLEYGPDNWHQDITGADMILSAYRLLHGEAPCSMRVGFVSASRHRTTDRTRLTRHIREFYDYAAPESILGSLPESATYSATVLITFRKESFLYLVISIILPDGEAWTYQTIPGHLQFEKLRTADGPDSVASKYTLTFNGYLEQLSRLGRQFESGDSIRHFPHISRPISLNFDGPCWFRSRKRLTSPGVAAPFVEASSVPS